MYVPNKIGGSNINIITIEVTPIENDNLGAGSAPAVSSFAEMDMKCALAGISAKTISMCVVSVMIDHFVTKKEESIIGMLNNYSQRTFRKESSMKKPGVSRRKTKITIRALNGK